MSDDTGHPDGETSRQGERRLRLSVPGMDCPSCAGKVDGALAGVEGLRSVETRPTAGTVLVTLDSGGDRAAAVRAVESAGYEVVDTDVEGRAEDGDGGQAATAVADRESVWWGSRAKKTWVGAVFLAAGLALEYPLHGANGRVASPFGEAFVASDLFFLAAVAASGQAILRGGYYSARNRNLDIDFLMSTAILAAVAASLLSSGRTLYSEAATLAVLFSVAELLEDYAMDRTRGSMRELLELSPDEATVRRDGGEVTVPVSALRVGDVALVRPGEKVPADGRILEGQSAVDEAPITGESVPVEKSPGDEVYAGTINEGGYLELEVTTPPGEDTLSRILELVEQARSRKTDREQFVERFAGYYTPVMVTLAVAVAAVPPLFLGGDPMRWLVAGITMLVLACPCAFVIATPVSVVSGVTSAARNGVLVKGGDHLEAMGDVEAVAFDKTGTLTEGELTVTDVVGLNGNSEAEVLRCARGVESRSEHPIASAIVDEAAGAGTAGGPNGTDDPGAGSDGGSSAVAVDREVSDFENLAGRGVRASLDGTPHYAGKPALFDDLGFDLEHAHVVEAADDGVAAEVRSICERNDCVDLAADTIPRLQREGKTVVLVGTADELEGVVAVADRVRPEARWTVERLKRRGIATVMLTGDNERTARAVAEAVGVDDYRADLLPEAKVDAVEDLEREYDGVAMVGDGVNDGPALATATVGVAMGAAGTDTAIEAADVALLGDDLSKLPYLAELSARTNRVIRTNVWASLAAKAVLAVGVPFGVVSVAVAVLVGDAGMTLGVTGNALRLARIAPDKSPGAKADAE